MTQFSCPRQGSEFGYWDPGDRFIQRWPKVSDVLVNQGSWAQNVGGP